MADFQNTDPARKPPDYDADPATRPRDYDADLAQNPSDHDADPASRPPDYKLYSVGHIALAAFLGSPIAGGLLIASNHRKLGNPSAAWGWAAFGVLLTGVLFAVGYMLPAGISGTGVAAGGVFAMYQVAKQTLGADIEEHEHQRGQMASGWAAAGIGLACLVVVFAVVFTAIFALTPSDLGEAVKFGDNDIHYTEGATEQEARALLGVLRGTFGMTEETGMSVQLRRDGDAYVVALALQDDAWDDPEILAELRDLALKASVGIFNNQPVDVEVRDFWWDVKRTIKWDSRAGD